MSNPELPASILSHPRLGDWIRIHDDGIEIRSGKVELGQGISAALIKTACLALGVTPAQVRLVAGDTVNSPNEGYTSGSQSIELGVAALHHACVALRQLAAAAAAQRWPGAALSVAGGVFCCAAQPAGLSYRELAAAAADADWPAQRIDHWQDPKGVDAVVLGQADSAFVRADLELKLSGAGFIHDLVRPGMLHARVLRGAHALSRPRRYDASALRALAGVQHLLIEGEFLALAGPDEASLVVAAAAARLLIDWELPELLPFADAEAVLTALPAVTSIAYRAGPALPEKGAKRLVRRYSRPYIAHGAIGTCCAVAEPAAGPGLTIWTHSQGVFQLRAEIAQALGLAPAALHLIHQPGSGCYGHNGADDVAFDAALIALKLRTAVRVVWSREDELSVAPVGAAGLVELQAGLDEQGMITDWQAQVWSHSHLSRPGWGVGMNLLGAWACDPAKPRPVPTDVPLPAGGGLRNAVPGYDLPAVQVQHHFVAASPLRVSALRSLGAHANVFATESFIDELAAAAGADPLDFRLRHLGDPRARRTLETVAAMSGWRERGAGGEGEGLGLGFARYKNRSGYCAVAIEVRVEDSVQVRRVWCAVDAGAIVHHDGLLNQVEGGILQALSWSLKESVRWGPEGVLSANWDEYPILTFAEVPEVMIELLDQPGKPSLGAGELAAGPVAGALGNAIAAALGLRARHLPFAPERLLALVHSAGE